MKYIKFAIPAVAVMMALASCSDKGYWEEYTNSKANYSFVTAQQTFTYEGVNPDVTVTINRNSTEGSVTVPIEVVSDSPEITGPSEVTFEDGKNQAQIKLTVGDGVPCGKNQTTTIKIKGDVEDFNMSSMKVVIYREYTFSPLGEGMISSPEGIEYEWPVEVQKANESDYVFRILDPYYVMGTEDAEPMVITCNSDYTLAVFKTFFPGFSFSGYEVQLACTNYGTIEGNEITFPVEYYAYGDGSLAGSFGNYPETVIMPDGWHK